MTDLEADVKSFGSLMTALLGTGLLPESIGDGWKHEFSTRQFGRSKELVIRVYRSQFLGGTSGLMAHRQVGYEWAVTTLVLFPDENGEKKRVYRIQPTERQWTLDEVVQEMVRQIHASMAAEEVNNS